METEITKKLGKIESVEYGHGGYQEGMIGISFQLSFGNGLGVGDFWGYWCFGIEHDENCKWTEEERIKFLGETAMKISKLLLDAKVESVDELKGIPIEVSFEGFKMKSWRVLTEVL